jgi:hypothetical protein
MTRLLCLNAMFGKVWKSMEKYGKVWKSMEKLVGLYDEAIGLQIAIGATRRTQILAR